MDDDDYIHACWAMENDSSSFVKKLAELYYAADSFNRLTLRITFYSHFAKGLEDYERSNERRITDG